MITKKLEQERYRYRRHVQSELHERINRVVRRSRDLPSLYPDVTIANTSLDQIIQWLYSWINEMVQDPKYRDDTSRDTTPKVSISIQDTTTTATSWTGTCVVYISRERTWIDYAPEVMAKGRESNLFEVESKLRYKMTLSIRQRQGKYYVRSSKVEVIGRKQPDW